MAAISVKRSIDIIIVKFVVLLCWFCIPWVFMFRQSSQQTSQETHVYLHEFKRSWFVIRDWCISIRFVCFVFQGSWLCDRPVLGNNRLVKFASQIFMVFFILVSLARIKQYLPSSFDKKSTHHFLRCSCAVQSHSQPSQASMLHCDLH